MHPRTETIPRGVYDLSYAGARKASGTKYVPAALFEEWGKRPVANFENYLLQFDIANEQFIQQTRDEIKQLIDDEWKIAFAADEIKP